MPTCLVVALFCAFHGEVTVAKGYAVGVPPKSLNLSPFYQKHIDVGGLPVVGSGKVSDYALREAAYIIRSMTSTRPEILRAMADNHVRLAVMAADERTVDIPEHSDLTPSSYWNRRARGLGATPHRPAVSCGEENLLQYRGDPYSTENILIHEFAHGIHQMGMNTIDPDFDQRLEAAFQSAKARGLWHRTYAMSNRMEYWAEAVQSWFNTNRHDDSEHNHVDTRKELRAYDPGIVKLVEEVFPGNDWSYTFPTARREPGHLAGFDLSKAPKFSWDQPRP